MKYTKIIEFEDIKAGLVEVKNNFVKCFMFGILFFVIVTILTFNKSVDNYYSATSSLYCPVNTNYSYSETNASLQVVSNYSSMIKSQRIAERAISLIGNTELTYKDIQQMVSYHISTSGLEININATSADPNEAVKVANAVADAFVEEMRTMLKTDMVQVFSPADKTVLMKDGLTELWKKRLVFWVLGCILMAAVIFARELFSDKIRSASQCMLTDEDVILGMIPEEKKINGK